jgi:hypothetical protein
MKFPRNFARFSAPIRSSRPGADPGLTFTSPLGIVRDTLVRQLRRFELCLRALQKFS